MTIVSGAPLQLRGVAFKPAIVVTVAVATSDGRIVKRLRTTATGRFTARFAVAVDECTGAIGAKISTAAGYRLSLRLAPRRTCPPLQPVDQ